MLRLVAIARTEVSEKGIASIIKVTRICSLGTLAVIATRHNITEDGTVYSHRRESIKSYIALTGYAL
jgi:hypothetical protein